jgi:hypothetical protein
VDHLAFDEKEKNLAARHEAAHVVLNAAKGRRFDEVKILSRDDGSYNGVTYVRIFNAGGTESGDMRGIIGDINEHFAKARARADAINAAQQAKIELPIEDELITLAAGIAAEEIIVTKKGWQIDNIEEKIQGEQDIVSAKEIVHKAGRTKEFAILWQNAQSDASLLLRRADIHEAWDLMTALLLEKKKIEWKDMDEQMIARLTRLSGRSQLI